MIRLQRILVATDFSEHSKLAWKYGLALASQFGSELLLVHVMEPPDILSQLPPSGEAYFPANMVQLQEQHAQQQFQEMLPEAGNKNVRTLLKTGSPFVEIVTTAREEQADLIIVGTHGRGFLAHVLMGSVAERVARKAPCPVLTVRVGEHEFVMP